MSGICSRTHSAGISKVGVGKVMFNFDNFMVNVKQSMAGKYRISSSVQLPDELIADLTASRTYFSWKGPVILSQHLIVIRMEKARVDDIKQLFDTGFILGKHLNRVPLLRGMQFGFMIIPIIATPNPDEELLQYAESQPRKHWSLFEFPVVIDLETGKTHYYRKTSAWGSFFFSDMRNVVSRYIENSLK